MAARPCFLNLNGRRLFCLHVPAEAEARMRVLVAPPFAEELNKCRRLLALTAEALAARGCDVLIPDLFGTGDSEGDFSDATWDGWRGELDAAADWLRRESAAPEATLLAVRSGSLLAANAAAPPDALVAWQPVLDGRRFLQQFLRLRVMASKLAGGDESVKDLEARLSDGEDVEVAGYLVSAGLARGLSDAALRADGLMGPARSRFLEFRTGANAALTRPVQQLVDLLCDSGRDAAGAVVAAEQFWATQEIAAPAEAVAATVEAALGSEQAHDGR